ncbi:MAG: ABC transporter substrate-binding protein [Ilumatobacteraceae bacterium]
MTPIRSRRTRRARGRVGAVPLVAVLVGALAACTSDDADPPDTTVATTTTTTTLPPQGDDILSMGLLLPGTGPGAQLGDSMIEGARLAVDRINEAGGVFGEPVRLLEADEGGGVASAVFGIESLVADGVDAIVGPASSNVALGALSTAVSAGVLTCSPSATAIALDDFPDDGLFHRTAPSDTLQAEAMAQVAEQTGLPTVAIAHIDDAYGRDFADAVEGAMSRRSLRVQQRVGFAPDETDLSAQAVTVLTDEPGVVVVVGDADATTRMLEALADAAPLWLPPRILVTDAARDARSSQAIVDLPSALRQRVEGVAPLAAPPDSEDFDGPFSAHAYDCVNLIALAALQVDSDVPSRIATQMSAVSVGGSVCRSFSSCADRIADGLQVDYDGVSGAIQLSSRGDPRRAHFEVFAFDDEGRDVPTGTVLDVSS